MRINYERIVHYVYHHHVGIILIAMVLTVVGVSFAMQLRIKADTAHLLPDDYKSVLELNRIKAQVGGIGPSMVIITGENLQRCVDFMLVLADSLEQNRLISSVIRGKSTDFFSRNRLLYMDIVDLKDIHTRLNDYIDLEKLKRSPLYFSFEEEEEESNLDFSDLEKKYEDHSVSGLDRDYYLTEEKNGVILRLYPDGVITDIEFTRKLRASLDSTIKNLDPTSFHPTIRYDYQGSFRNASQQYEIVVKSLRSSAMYAFLGVLLLIIAYFRQLFAPIFIIVPLLMSLAWTFGLTKIVIGNLNQITVCLFAILFGLGIDFGIHILARYREARRRDVTTEDALLETVVHTGSALTTTAVTTSLAFFSLLFSDFKGFSEFGFIVGIGILFSLGTMIIVCPAFIVLAERFNLIRFKQKSVPVHLTRMGRYPFSIITVAIGIVITAYSIFHLNDLEFEYDFKKLRPQLSQTGPKASLPEILKETRSPAIVLTENQQEAENVVETVKKIKADRGDSSTIRSVKSVYNALPENQDDKLLLIAQMRRMLNKNETLINEKNKARTDSLRKYFDVSRLSLDDLPVDMTKSFSSKDGEILSFVMINAAVPLRDGRNAINFAREIKQIDTEKGTFYASSAHIIFAEMLQLMLDDAAIAVGITLAVVAIVLLIDLRNIVDTLFVLTPLLAALAWVTGIMYLFNFRLNIYNMVAFPTIIGMGIDNAVHVFHRYKESGEGSLQLVLRTTGVALAATTLTTMIGFAGLLPSSHPALYWIGMVSLLGLGCCFIAAVTLLPAFLQLRENKK